MNIAFITRTKGKEDLDHPDLKNIVKEVFASGIKHIYIVSNFDKKVHKIDSIGIQIVKDKNPTSPVSINTVLEKIKNNKESLDAFLVSSKEIGLNRADIKKLIKEIEKDKNLLVAGFKFTITDKNLNKELQEYYSNKDLIAYQVPWNTCAIWNYKLFDQYIGKFDEITDKNPFPSILVCIDNICTQTDHKGMEDGLAIAKALSIKEKSALHFKLLNENPLPWKIDSNYDKRLKHKKKLARKDRVMRNFIELRGYKIENLSRVINSEGKLN